MNIATAFGFDKVSEEEKTRRVAFLRITVFSAIAGVMWGSSYVFFKQYGAVIAGSVYLLFVTLNLLYLRLTRNYKIFRLLGLVMLLLNPIASQLSLGGFVGGSAVILSSSLAPISALTIQSVKASRLFFYSYCLVVICVGVAEFIFLTETSSSVPKNVSLLFFVSNSITIPTIFYFVLEYFFKQQRKFKKIVEEKNLLLTEQQDEITANNEELIQQKEELVTTLDVVQNKNEIIRKQNRSVRASIMYARRIQHALLPFEDRMKDYFGENYFVFNQPRDIVSGDFYWCEKIEDSTILVVADCTGHGVPGAFMSMLGATGLNHIIFQEDTLDAHEILNALHRYIYKSLQQEKGDSSDGMDITVLVLRPSRSIAEFAGAMNPLYYVQEDNLHHIKGDIMPIGGKYYGKIRSYTKHIISIAKPTTFYMASDGFQDQFGGKNSRKFMRNNFKKLLHKISSTPMSEQKKTLSHILTKWKGTDNKQIDDVLIVGVGINHSETH